DVVGILFLTKSINICATTRSAVSVLALFNARSPPAVLIIALYNASLSASVILPNIGSVFLREMSDKQMAASDAAKHSALSFISLPASHKCWTLRPAFVIIANISVAQLI